MRNKIYDIGRLMISLALVIFYFNPVISGQEGKLIYIKAKKIYTCDENQVIHHGGLLIQDGKFLLVDKKGKPPKEAEVVDWSEKIIIPCLIDSHCSTGFHEKDFTVKTTPSESDYAKSSRSSMYAMLRQTKSRPLKVEVRTNAGHAILHNDQRIRDLLTAGITMAKIALPCEGLTGGISVCVNPAADSPDEFIIKEEAGMEFSLSSSENVANKYGDLREIFWDAQKYRRNFQKYEKDLKKYQEEMDKKTLSGEKEETPPQEPEEPRKDENKELILKVLDRKIPAMIKASQINEIEAALKIAEEFNLNLVLVGGEEAYRIAGQLASKGISVIAGPTVITKEKEETIFYIKELLKQNVCVALGSHSNLSHVNFPFQLWKAYIEGISDIEALKMATINAARILGVDNRTGSITRGKEANFLILSDMPFEPYSQIEKVYMKGKLVDSIR